jgi:gliding motility-associated-like protein
MNKTKQKKLLILVFLSFQTLTYAQLGFCNGSSGAPIFFENFGSGLDYGPALPAGVTSYDYVGSGFPLDGKYTLFHRTNLIPNSQNWMYSLDHTPDNQANGVNGKMLIVNASTTAGQFYNRTVTGLCSNTTFEFSAWVLNILNATTNGLPINVTFEIWDATDTVLLKTGSTGIIPNTFSPVWNQFGLVFTMPAGQTSVILKMRNNGVGGNGNDLAIDDIMFRACGETSIITNSGNATNTISICQNETIPNSQLQVNTSGTGTNVYQWQQSSDSINFTDLVGETSSLFTIPNPTATIYYRVKIANDISNLNNAFCSTLSNIFIVIVNQLPNAPVSGGNRTLCSNQNSILSVTVSANQSVNWFDTPTNGNLLQANSLTFSPTNAGTYYAEAYNLSTTCKSNTRTAVTLLPMITASFSGTTTICSGETTAISLAASDTNATFNWTATSTNVTGFSNGTGNTINQTLNYIGTATGTVTYVVTPIINGCEGMQTTIVVTINPQENITLSFASIPTAICVNSVSPLLPSSSSNTTPISGTWNPSTITTSLIGTSTYTFTPQITGCVNIAPFSIQIEIIDTISPNFDATISLCSGSNAPTLNAISPNGISGTWNPSTIDNINTSSYVFTPNTNQCTVSQTITVNILPSNTSLSFSGNTSICSGETTAISLTSTSTNVVYNWTATSTNVTGFSNGTGNTINQTLNYIETATGTVTYVVTPIVNGCEGISETIVVTVSPINTISLIFPTIQLSYCINETASVLPTNSSNTSPISGTWNPSNIDTSTLGVRVYIFTPQVNDCQNIQPYEISVAIYNGLLPNFNDSISICEGTIPPILNDISPNEISGTWNPSTIDNINTASYVFTPNTNQCAVSQTITVNILEPTLSSISYTTSGPFSENQIVTILVLESGNYLYQLDNGPLQQSNIFSNVSAGSHTITVIDVNGCSAPISKEIFIIDYPKFFTPNGDGINDFWIISGLNLLKNPKVFIFDRYGKLIFQIKNNMGWDGTINGVNLPANDYWFTIDFEYNSNFRTFKSHFSLMR